MAGRAGEFCGGGFLCQFLFEGFVTTGDTEHNIHLRAGTLLHGATIKARAAFDGVIKELGFGVVAFLNACDSSERLNPFENESDDVNRESRRRMVKRFSLDLRAVLEKRWKVFVGALGKALAEDDDGHAGRAEIFLCAGKDEAELLHVDGFRGDV